MFKFIKNTFHGGSARPPKRTSLLGLPPELRERIYALAIPRDGYVEPDPKSNCVINIRDDVIVEFPLLPPLAQVNRQLHHECAAYFLGHNTFVVEFTRYHREYGHWLWQVEHLWPYLSVLVLQLDSPNARARKEDGPMLEARVRSAQEGRVVNLAANLALDPSQQEKVAGAMKAACKGAQLEAWDGRALVAVTMWLVDNVFVGDLAPVPSSTPIEWDVQTVMAS